MSSFTEDEREEKLRHLMDVYGDGLKRLCCVYLRDLGLAEDAVQETFIKAYDHIDELLAGEIESAKAWLMRIAVNTCKDTLRSSWMRHIDRRQEIETLPLSIASCPEEKLALTQAIMALPPKLREIVLLYYYQDMSLRTCANVLGISAPKAYELTHRADFPAFRIGNRTLVSRRLLAEWVDAQVSGGKGGTYG